jgi:putative ABC transport system permease protein
LGNLKLALLLAFKSIVKGNHWALVMIILVMSLSFANLILTPSIISGVTVALDTQQVNTLFANILIDPNPDKYYLEHAGNIEKKLEQYPGVIGVSSRLNSGAFFEYDYQKLNSGDKGISGNWNVIGIDPAKESAVTTIHNNIIEGSYLDADDKDAILLGVEIAGGEKAQSSSFLTLEGVRVGDKVRVTYPNGVQREYRVKGIFRTREMQADRLAFVTNKEMTAVLGRSVFADRASQILVSIKPQGSEAEFIAGFESIGIDGVIRDWKEYGGSAGSVTSSFNVIASLIGAIGLIVAAIVMFIVIYINVLSKKRQIGILRAIGVNRNVILISYLAQAMFYAVLGIVFGGLMFGYGILPYFASHPIDLPIGQVSLAINPLTISNAVAGILIAAALAGILPVLNITHQSIIKAIWGT